MSIDVPREDRIEMSQRERDVLKVMNAVLLGERTQAEAARLLELSVRQVRRIQRKLEEGGDGAIVHGLRGKPSNHQPDATLKRKVLRAYRKHYHDFGPTFASEKLADDGLDVSPQTLRRWLIEAGLWKRQRRREAHRSRRPRRACFGELVQMDASIHDWLEGRGEELVLISMIDDATSVVLARFYPAGTVETHMDLLGRWLRRYGRPVGLYTDRHSIFEPQDKGRALPGAETQFGRALDELGIELTCARSPQAKGRVERSFNTAQDRWVKELRLEKVKTCVGANKVLERLLPDHNHRFSILRARGEQRAPGFGGWARPGGDPVDPGCAGGGQRLHGPVRQSVLPTAAAGVAWAAQGEVVIEERLDGSMKIRYEGKYLKYQEVSGTACPGGSAPRPPEFNASTADASKEEDPAPGKRGRAGMQPTGGRSGCTPAEPCPPDGEANDSAKPQKRPAQDHPWRKSFKPQK